MNAREGRNDVEWLVQSAAGSPGAGLCKAFPVGLNYVVSLKRVSLDVDYTERS